MVNYKKYEMIQSQMDKCFLCKSVNLFERRISIPPLQVRRALIGG